MSRNDGEHWLALSGGVGGAKLALGLSRILPPAELTTIANTGDDFDHLGLRICPDLDTLLYTLAGLANPQTGWGRADESGAFMDALRAMGGEDWFFLGDKDLALHVERTRRLKAGESLTDFVAAISRQLGIASAIIPMTDDPVRTMVNTADGWLPFQHYFVRDKCVPEVTGFAFDGIEQARPQPEFMTLLGDDNLSGVIICPSNPFVSIDPVLALAGVRAALDALSVPIIAVSPIIGGKAIKGPAAKMMDELGLNRSALGVARHYQGLIDGFVLDHADAEIADAVRDLGMAALVTDTVMVSLEDREELAENVLDFARQLTTEKQAKPARGL